MHQLRVAGKPARISAACSDELESMIAIAAAKHGMKPSQYIETVLRDEISSQSGLQDLPLPARFYHAFEDAKRACANGKLSPIERSHLTDHIAEILFDVRATA